MIEPVVTGRAVAVEHFGQCKCGIESTLTSEPIETDLGALIFVIDRILSISGLAYLGPAKRSKKERLTPLSCRIVTEWMNCVGDRHFEQTCTCPNKKTLKSLLSTGIGSGVGLCLKDLIVEAFCLGVVSDFVTFARAVSSKPMNGSLDKRE